ncbi:ATP-dependent DNA helicase DinG [Calidifontibacillus oryziterrae]|uniref:ATP-dependent DNA helicase DinG n=1 Tax=Calidifontibacillus oryziterrae TaxID=1191699 RepID=UPI0002DF66BB|nr:ATP-dependent DNA helicase DinG [Calidifontibacillus oryziterrae]
MNNRFVVVDVETTGNKVGIDKIIQVGAILIENGEIIERFSSFVNPNVKLSPFIKQFTGIDDMMLEKAPSFSLIAPMLFEMVTGSYFVAHNVPFDLTFLKVEFENSGYELNDIRSIDTVELSRFLYPTLSGYKLNQLASEFAIEHDQPHRADSDAEVTAYLLLNLLTKLRNLPLATLLHLKPLSAKLHSDYSSLINEAIEAKQESVEIEEVNQYDVYRGLALKTKEKQNYLAEDANNDFKLDDKTLLLSRLQRIRPEIEVRPGQIEMMEIIEKAFQKRFHALLEAGTGTGKTIAYLLPSIMFARKFNRPIVISTYTTQLQEQIISQEMKLLREALPFSIRAAVLKGRNHYLCLRKFEQYLADSSSDNYDTVLTKCQILIWLTETVNGDVDELNLSSGGRIFWNKVKSDTQSCTNSHCPWFSRCFYQLNRNHAQIAHVIITNHALLLADMKHEYSLLPAYSELVIDEAHHLEDAASEHLGVQLDYLSIQTLLNQIGMIEGAGLLQRLFELTKEGDIQQLKAVRGVEEQLCELKSSIDELFRSIRTFALSKNDTIKNEIGRISYRYQISKESGVVWKDVKNNAYATIEVLKDFKEAFTILLGSIEHKKDNLTYVQQGYLNDSKSTISSLDVLKDNLCKLLYEVHMNRVTWIETEPKGAQNSTYLFSQPIDPSDILADQLFAKKDSVILTSATLAVKNSFEYIKERIGLNDFEVLTKIIPSPFSYKDQVQLLIPTDVPQIKDVDQEQFIKEIADRIVEIARITKGRMLLLFTAFDMLEKTYYAVKQSSALDSFVLIGQGISSGSREKLTKNFKRYDQAILFGTSSFWEGIDIPGEALSCIVIVRLPFSPPDQPILAAKAELLKQAGKNAFMELYLPQAILRFKQGFGRLVRARNDRGVVIVLDRRIVTKSYGKKFISALPQINIHEAKTTELVKKLNEWL